MSPPGATVGSKTDEILNAVREGRCEEAVRILEGDLSLVGACNPYGVTPLHFAARTHQPTMVAWLLDHGARVDARAFENGFGCPDQASKGTGLTPLDFAVMVAGWSVDGRNLAFMENASKAPELFYETVRLLRARGADLTPRAAVALGDTDAVLQLHRKGQLQNEIHMLRGGLLSIAVRVERIDMVSLLLDSGLDPDEPVTAEDGSLKSWGMPLWFATQCGRYEIAELLLARGADVNATVYACGDPFGRAEDERMQKLLLEYGARLTVERVTDRQTVQAILDGILPAYSLNADEATISDLAEQMLRAAMETDPEIVRMCLPYTKRKPTDPWWGNVIAHAGLPASVQLLLNSEIDPDVLADGGYTALHHLATANRNPESRVALATILLDAGASLGIRDRLLESTPLGWACRWGRADLVRLYLQRGADALEPDAESWATPVARATKEGHGEIVELLRSWNTGK